jgi:hypothetical protein
MMRPSKTLAVVCVITAAALFGGCQPSQPAGAAANEPVMNAQPSEKQAPTKAAQVKKAGATTVAANKTAPDATHAAARPAGPKVMVVRQEEPIITTITGCLERAGDLFRLTNTTGDDAPKARSWKSGFIKKSSSSIDIIEGATRLKLAGHVGHRVSITGLLDDRQMQARSVRVTSEGCE